MILSNMPLTPDTATITYVDCDNTILGTQVVPTGVDIRRQVNDYVKQNFIHPELREGHDVASIERTDSYRGKYPHEGPEAQGGEVEDGELYPLTKHLDYVFFKHPLVEEVGEDGLPTGRWVSKTDENGLPVHDEKCPFAYGWALCGKEEYAKVTTAIGVGPFIAYRSTGSLYGENDAITLQYDPAVDDNSTFQIADLEQGITKDVWLKAVYEQTPTNGHWSYAWQLSEAPYYYKKAQYNERLGLYTLRLRYSRISKTGANDIRGCAVMVDPKYCLEFTLDLAPHGLEQLDRSWNNGVFEYLRVDATKVTAEEMVFDISLPYAAHIIDGGSRECYDGNVISGASGMDLSSWFDEADRSNFMYLDCAKPYENRHGTDGFVLRCYLQTIANKAKLLFESGINDFLAHLYPTTAIEINLRAADGKIMEHSPWYNINGDGKLRSAYQKAYNNGWLDAFGDPYLTSHQLQHYLLTEELLTAEEAEKKTFWWCRLHPHCLFAGILEYAHQVVTGEDADAINNISSCGMRMGLDGTAVTDILEFAAKVVEVVRLAGDGYAALTKDQVQYYLIHGGDAVPDATLAATESAEKYWWFDGDETELPTTFQMMVAAADKAAAGRPALLNQLEPAFNEAVAGNDAQWRTKTYNLRANENGELFVDFATFRAALISAVTALGTKASWDQVQHHVIHKEALDADAAFEYAEDHYWWYRDGVYISDSQTLWRAGKAGATYGRLCTMSSLTYERVYNDDDAPNDINKFAKAMDGTPFAREELRVLWAAIQDAEAEQDSALSWNGVQYGVIHGTGGYNWESEGKYHYWWHNDVEPWNITVGTGSYSAGGIGKISAANIASLMVSVQWAVDRKNPYSMGNLTPEMAAKFRLAYSITGNEAVFTDVQLYDTKEKVDVLKERLKDLYRAAQTYTFTLYQIQHYLLTGQYLLADDPALPGREQYWWLWKDEHGNDLALFLAEMDKHAVGDITDNDLKAAVDIYFDAMIIHVGPLVPATVSTSIQNKTYAQATGFQAALKTKIVNLCKAVNNKGYKPSEYVTWYMLQYYSVTTISISAAATPKTPDFCEDYYKNTIKGSWAPDYVSVTEAEGKAENNGESQ